MFMEFLQSLLTPENITIVKHIGAAVVAGGLIGLERSYHGRPAGFRTHALVCLASSSLMMITVFQTSWMGGHATTGINMDPTRMAQGIMTGIGFLGAGVIYKEGISVRGLTTAASIWITSAIGILMGVGLFFPGILATLTTLGILAYFHVIEHSIPKRSYIHCNITFDREKLITETELRKMLSAHGLNIGNLSYHCIDSKSFEYQMIIRTMHSNGAEKLAGFLAVHPEVRAYAITPSGD